MLRVVCEKSRSGREREGLLYCWFVKERREGGRDSRLVLRVVSERAGGGSSFRLVVCERVQTGASLGLCYAAELKVESRATEKKGGRGEFEILRV